MKFLYLLIDLCTIAVPFIFSFHPKLNFYKRWKEFFIGNFIAACLFIGWDIYFTKIGVWGFNSDYLTGIFVFNLPLEEILFFICIPYACIFTYHCLNLFFKIQWKSKTENIFVIAFALLLLITGIVFHSKIYTSYTFISLAVLLWVLKFIVKANWLPKLISIYPILLLPFFIVNGILTGTGIEQPVVWYNNNENLGIRLLTIPIEDVFYGFELIVLTLFIYEYLSKKNFNSLTPTYDSQNT